jgi:hypothetical protein
MIIFASAYDEATRANHLVASRLQSADDVFLGAEHATRPALRGALAQTDEPLFAMSHGSDDMILAQGGSASAPALSADEVELAMLRGRSVFAHACLTGRELGKAMSRKGSIYWGYAVKVNAPEVHPQLLNIFVDVFSFIKSAFAHAKTGTSQDAFFAALRERCEAARDRLDDIDQPDGGFEVPMGAYQCLIQVERDLLVWAPGDEAPRTPPHVRGRRVPLL